MPTPLARFTAIDSRTAPPAGTTSDASRRSPGSRCPVSRHPLRAAGLALAGTLAALGSPAARAVEPLQQLDIVLLQPGKLIEQRIDGGADAMADYLKRLGATATDTMRANPQQIPSGGFLVVALRPGGQAHIWFDFKPALSDVTTAALTQALEAVPSTPVKQGDVVFALRVSIWGGRPPAGYAPAPPAWRDAASQAGHKPDIDTLVDQVWPR